MNVDEIKLLYEYNYWADWRILTACANVTPEQYVAPAGYSSLRGTIVHKLDSDQGWRLGFQRYFVPADRVDTQEPKMWEDVELTESDLPTLDALKERWQIEEREMRAYLARLSDQDLDGYVIYRVPEGVVRKRVLWHCLVHVANHGTQHRSEAALILTGYDASPGGLDLTAFLNEHVPG